MLSATLITQRKRRLGNQYTGTAPPPPFAPTDIAGLKLWLDFSDITTLFQDDTGLVPVTADGDVIGMAQDKSGNLNHASQGTTANKPTYKTGIQNGLSIGRFNGSNNFMNTVNFAGIAQPYTIIIAGIPKTGSGPSRVIDTNGISANRIVVTIGPVNRQFYAGTDLYDALGTADVAVVMLSFGKGATSYVRWNGGQILSGNAGTNSIGGFRLGYDGVTTYGTIEAFEYLLYNSEITGVNLTNLETYINTKWAAY